MAERKKTPSARVIAARWILRQIGDVAQAHTLTSDSLTELAQSRVGYKKVGKVKEQIGKITNKLRERMEKIVDKFENPPAKKAGKPVGKPFGKVQRSEQDRPVSHGEKA